MRLIVSDLDGTLLNNNCKISKENIQALKHAHSKGIEIVIASGRIYADVDALCKEANIAPYIISNNGACIWSKKAEKIRNLSINSEDVMRVMKYLTENKICYQMATDKKVYIPENWKDILQEEYVHLGNPKGEATSSYIIKSISSQNGLTVTNDYNDVIKKESHFYTLSAVSFDKNKLSKAKKHFEQFNSIVAVASNANSFEVMNKLASKGSSLEHLSKYLNISLKDIMTIGDNYNDESMLKISGVSVAMGNGEEYIKTICNYVTKSNELHGVAHAIYNELEVLNYSEKNTQCS